MKDDVGSNNISAREVAFQWLLRETLSTSMTLCEEETNLLRPTPPSTGKPNHTHRFRRYIPNWKRKN